MIKYLRQFVSLNFFILILVIISSFIPVQDRCHQSIDSPALSKSSKSSGKYQYDLALVGIFRNEAPYLKEWIEFHLLVGFKHFYLFNNLSDDEYLSVLNPYINKGIVELIDWPYESTPASWNGIQCSAYEDALKRAKGKVKWLAFLDTDEFIFPVQEDNLANFLKKYDKFAGLSVNWVLFGTSYIPKIPDNELLIDTLTYRGEIENAGNLHVKSIVRPEFVSRCVNPHFVFFKKNYSQVNSDKVPFFGAFSPYVQVNAVRINHYTYRDEYFLLTHKVPRLERLSGYFIDSAPLMDNFNQIFDDTILRYVPRLKERMMTANANF